MTRNFYFKIRNRLWAIFLTMVSLSAFAQQKTVTGTITDGSGEALPGVGITLKGTTKGTMTDVMGAYSISINSSSDVLMFSYIGYKKEEVIVGDKTILNLQLLEDSDLLDELVVVGYGTITKANLTGAVSTIGAKAIADRPIANLASGLQGVSPGLIINRTTGQPGREGIAITIRGATSANGNVNPLVVLDGVTAPISVLTTLNPNDVESISILKDAAAAIYGAQAAGGVILVTTKKGTKQKTQVSFTSILGAAKVINMPKRMSLLDEALFNNLAFTNSGANRQYSDFDLDNIKNNIPYVINPNDTTNYLYYNQVPASDILLKDYAFSQNYNLSFRGGTDKINYFLSGGMNDQNGIIKYGPDNSKRYNARLNLGINVNKYLSIDTRTDYTNQSSESSSASASGDYGIIYEISRLRTRNPLLTPEGNYNTSNSTLGKLKEGGFNNNDQNIFGGVATIKIANFLEGLTLRAVFGVNYRIDGNKNFSRTVPLWSRFKINNYLNPTNSVNTLNETRRTTNIQYLADYNKTFAEKHAFGILGGFQYEDFRYQAISAGASNLISNDLPVLGLGDALTKTNSESVSTFASKSMFGRFNYIYNSKYIAEVTYRWDENSKLAPSLRQKGFIGVSAGWNMHLEEWFNNALPLFSEFKLRGSWGRLGGALGNNLGNYDYVNLLNNGSGLVLGNSRATYFFQGSIPSATLSWETIQTTNIGLDLGLLKNKLRFTGEYFIKYNRNMLTPQQLPAVLGVSTPKKNNGELKSWGWETEASYRDRIGSNVNYNIGFNLSDNQNELLSYSGYKVVGAGLNNLIEGQPLRSFYGYQTNGYYTSLEEVKNGPIYSNKTGIGDVRYVDQNGDGKLNVGDGLIESKGDLLFLGTDAARLSFGVTAGIDWKGIDVSIFVQGVGKRNFLPGYNSLAPLSESWRMPLQYHADYWTPENPNAIYPRPFYQGSHNYASSDKWVLNAAYARLKNFQIGYSLPNNITNKLKVDKARIFITGQDLFTVSKLGVLGSIFDPESQNGVVNDYPFFANLSVGLNLNF